MEEDHKLELQLLPTPHDHTKSSCSRIPRWPSSELSSIKYRSSTKDHLHEYDVVPSLDLQLSISVRPFRPPQSIFPESVSCVESLKWQAAEQIRLAALEKAYAERVREMTRREMEMAQSEFSRARHMWEKAREEVDKAEKLKERATRRIDPTCMEVTCQACRQKFRS